MIPTHLLAVSVWGTELCFTTLDDLSLNGTDFFALFSTFHLNIIRRCDVLLILSASSHRLPLCIG